MPATAEVCPQAIDLLLETEIYAFMPGLKSHKYDLMKLTQINCDILTINEMWALILYCMEMNDNKTVESFLREWKLPVKQIKEIQRFSTENVVAEKPAEEHE